MEDISVAGNPAAEDMRFNPAATMKLQVKSICEEAAGIRSYMLVAPDGALLPAFAAGAHIDVHLRSGAVRQYSLFTDPAERQSYGIAVLRDAGGRGGSVELHDTVRVGDLLDVSGPRNNFLLAEDVNRHVFVAGGIGITPILAMARTVSRRGQDWSLHYCIRELDKAAFLNILLYPPFVSRVQLHVDGGIIENGLNVAAMATAERGEGVCLYCCGPARLMSAVRDSCSGWPGHAVRFESFTNDVDAAAGARNPFEVEISDTGQVFSVSADETILEVLRRHGIYVPSLCTSGVCGTCVVDLLEGEADHRDAVIPDAQKDKKIAVCCSRARTRRIKISF